MFGQDLQELPYEDYNVDEFKVPNITSFTLKHAQSSKSPINFENHSFPSSFDNSLDQDIHLANAFMIKKTMIQYLKNSLTLSFDNHQIFYHSQVFKLELQEINSKDEKCTLQSLLYQNSLLTETQKQSLKKKIKEFEELQEFVQKLSEHFGKQILEEVIYLLFILLDSKNEGFNTLINKQNNELLPKIGRFWGQEDNEQIFKGDWAVYQQIDYDQVKKFASEGVEELAVKLYFQGKLKYITLQEIKCDIKDNLNVSDKFASLMTHLSKIFFLTLSGMAVNQDDFIQIEADLSLDLIEDRIQEKLSKKIKRDI